MKKAIKRSTIFGDSVDVYLLEDSRILLSNRGAVRALTSGPESVAAENTTLGRFLERLPSKYGHLATSPTERFIRPEGGTADGITPEALTDIMRAYSEALDDDLLKASQVRIAKNCNRILRALTEMGMRKLCEEALGIVRANAAMLFEEALFREEMAKDSIWPNRLVKQYCRWNGYRWVAGQSQPRAMKSLNGFFYEMIFPPEIRHAIRDKSLEEACRLHQTLNDAPRDYLKSNLAIATALALDSHTESTWRRKMRGYYGKGAEPKRGPKTPPEQISWL